LGPLSFHHLCRVRQEAKAGRRARRCLLKGCEQWFRPCHPLAHYCSEGCSRKASYWRRWHANQRYRASEKGRERRQEQSRRYRERCRKRRADASRSPPIETVPCEVEQPAKEGAASSLREGERPALKCGDFQLLPCDRPGCYELVVGRFEDERHHFCSSLCRLALRRVIDREKRYQRRLERRREGIRPRRLDTS